MRKQQGFTLIEAAVAIAVVAILSGIIAPLVLKNIKDSQVARAKNEVQVIAAALGAQLRDTGCRPTLAGAAGMGTGVADSFWATGVGTAATGAPAVPAANNLSTLLAGYTNAVPPVAVTLAGANAAFGTTAGNEFSWRGPYLSADVANKANPWGGKYYIFGLNANGQLGNTPIWVVCPGPENTLDAANVVTTSAGLPQVWNTNPATAPAAVDNIAIRVN